MPTAGSLKNGDRLKLDIGLAKGMPAMSIAGKVVWIKFNSRPAPLPLEAGIEFSAADAKDIESFINTAQS